MISLVITISFGAKKIKDAGEVKIGSFSNEKTILSVWQIDSFEGGIGSRRKFLEEIANSYEKIDKSTLFLVMSYTEEGAEENFKNGIYPDLISYGNGVYPLGAIELDNGNNFNGAKVGEKCLGEVWARGGYYLIENLNFKGGNLEREEVAVSSAKFTQPIIALLEEGILNKDLKVLKPLDAYVRFVGGKCKYLLGTQRDIVRLENKELNVKSTLLNNFSDLNQYVSVTTKDAVKREKAKDFVKFLLSKNQQEKLSKICMGSNYFNVQFDNENLNELNKINSKIKTISAFLEKEILLNLKEQSLGAYYGDKEIYNKIKNILI